jgi:hypothetical protein
MVRARGLVYRVMGTLVSPAHKQRMEGRVITRRVLGDKESASGRQQKDDSFAFSGRVTVAV